MTVDAQTKTELNASVPAPTVSQGWAVVTGASGSIGAALTEGLARRGYPVVMACRNLKKAEPIRQQIMERSGNDRIVVRELNLVSMASIGAFISRLRQEAMPISRLLNNAGVMNGTFRLSADGLEEDTAVNYVAAYALTCGLLPLMSPGSRIINTVSCTWRIGRVEEQFLQPDPEHFHRFTTYGSSKLALLLFTIEMARRLAGSGITIQAADPGVVDTAMLTMGRWFDPLADLFFRPLVKTPQQGAATALQLAVSPEEPTVSGGLWSNCKLRKIPRRISQHPLRLQLMTATQRLLEEHGLGQVCFDWNATKEKL